jgi:hypothetical protein
MSMKTEMPTRFLPNYRGSGLVLLEPDASAGV